MSTAGRPKRGVPEGLWIRCPQCKENIFRKEMEARFNVCPECGHHFYLPSRQRARDAGGDAHGGPLNALGGNQKKKDQKGVI